jgi:hypothetical protein
MSTQKVIHMCRACGVERIGPGIGDLPGDRTPCANDGCGSVDVAIDVVIADVAVARDLLVAKLKDASLGSRKGREVDVTTGAEYFRQGERWHRVDRIVNYADDWYDETITDETTGTVVRECHERLSDHQGRGGAARPPQDQ